MLCGTMVQSITLNSKIFDLDLFFTIVVFYNNYKTVLLKQTVNNDIHRYYISKNIKIPNLFFYKYVEINNHYS